MTFDEWIANDEGVKRFGLELRTEWVDAAREGWEAATRVSDAIQRLEAENANLRSVMVAAAEEIAAHWEAHCDDEGYGPANLMHRLEKGIPTKYCYTAGDFARLKAENEALKKDAERYRWLRGDCAPSSIRWPRFEVKYWTGRWWEDLRLTQMDATIDDAMTKEQKE